MRRDEVVVLAHAADEPAVLIGLPFVLLALFAFLEVRARRREQDDSSEDRS